MTESLTQINLKHLSRYQKVNGKIGELPESWGTPRSSKRLDLISWAKFNNRTVLDLGCNNGAFCFRAKEWGARRVIGVDKSDCIIGAREVAKQKGLNIEFWQVDIESVEFKNNFPKSDMIFLCSMLTHLKDPIDLIKKVAINTNWGLYFETNSGAKHKKQIDLIKQYTSFVDYKFLGSIDGHDIWQCWRAKNYRTRPKWYDLSVSFVPLDLIKGWTETTVNQYSKGYPLGAEKFLKLKEHIKRNGILHPLMVRKKGEMFEAVEGGHRYMAAKQLGYKELPCKVLIK